MCEKVEKNEIERDMVKMCLHFFQHRMSNIDNFSFLVFFGWKKEMKMWEDFSHVLTILYFFILM